MRVGFIGLGTMGRNAATNVRRKGFDLVVYDIRPEAAEPLVAMGAVAARSPADVLAAADVVVTMVFGPKQVAEVMRGPGGFLSGEPKGKIWIDMTTSSPFLMRELAAEFEARGGFAVDAPVTGSVDAAIRGDMPMFVGGDDAVIERVRPVIEAMGRLRKVGGYGNGYVAKLVNNQLWKIHAAAIGEAMVTAKLAGLDPLVWWEVMKGGAADSFVLSHDVPSIFAGHYDPSFPIALCLKDLDLIDELIRHTGTRNDLTAATHERFREAGRRYGMGAGEMTVCKVIEDDAGIDLRVPGDWQKPWEVKAPE
ncbi:NAD(P)-dependent oxidoreductase [Tabrizicola sp. J26]|uniref:NAD(P)-dependent oxidoreductase n=1 Tax=Alitabrizicola rongguiensis TaxID=2909234 RepID=UPI001F3A6F23|nr:NAD(P)-dependent oxidoreductase [Tabrizicola rongguiensis]MCF1709490.1 NAD(P)-dependent oxidoreductase [Tabrizicola rongguiensis]